MRGGLLLMGVAILASSCLSECTQSFLSQVIAAEHKIFVSDEWGGGHRIIFDFNGRRAWIVEPNAGTAIDEDRRWVWTMQWMGAFVNRTGAPDLVKKGWRHVHLEAFDTRASEEGLKALAAFQDYLVKKLEFSPKANLIGMSWGGFYSVRYAEAYPSKVEKIYLDAPLLNLDGFPGGVAKIGPWATTIAKNGKWSDDPRMPVNMAASLAAKKLPIYLLYGGQDQTVKPKFNCERFVRSFKAAGGDIRVEKRNGYGHHPHGFEVEDVGKIVDFFCGSEDRNQ